MDVYIGLDIGTTNIKMLLADREGAVLKSASYPLEIHIPRPAWTEQDPEDWWRGVMALLSSVSPEMRVRRIGLSGQMHTLVPLDKEGQVLRRAILWNDQRTAAECAEAEALLGGEEGMIARTGNLLYPGFTLPKLLWMRKNEPDIFSQIATCFFPKDYIGWRLTGGRFTDWSDASGSACYDVVAREWREDLLQRMEIPEAWLPPVRPSSSLRGTLRPELARELRWGETEVVCGGADNAVAALGIGVGEPGDCMISIGTSGTVLAATAGREPDPTGRLHFFNSVLPGQSYLMGCMLSAASSLNWFKETMGNDISWDTIERGINETPPGAGGLLWLPYLNGERTPHRNPNARGVLYGMSSMTGREHVFRAVMEGITYGLRDSFELITKEVAVQRVIIVGGGAKNAAWRRMVADNIHMPVSLPAVDEGGAYGAAMLAALGGDLSLDEVKGWVKIRETAEPSREQEKRYDEIYPQFRALYTDLKDRFDATAGFV